VIIAGHGAVAYGDLENAWPYQDVQAVQLAAVSNVALSLLVLVGALFAMGLFFSMSGLMVAASLARKGARIFARDRLTRLGAPVAAFWRARCRRLGARRLRGRRPRQAHRQRRRADGKIVKIARLPAGPIYPVAGGGSIWSASSSAWENPAARDDGLMRIDPKSLALQTTYHLGANVLAVGYGFGSVWAALANRELVRLNAGRCR
jgi:hypothetical protein